MIPKETKQEIIRLLCETTWTQRQIAATVGVSKSTVNAHSRWQLASGEISHLPSREKPPPRRRIVTKEVRPYTCEGCGGRLNIRPCPACSGEGYYGRKIRDDEDDSPIEYDLTPDEQARLAALQSKKAAELLRGRCQRRTCETRDDASDEGPSKKELRAMTRLA